MKSEFQVRRQVHAPVPVIWARLVDVTSWPEWTPTVTRAQSLGVGSTAVASALYGRLTQEYLQLEADGLKWAAERGLRG